MCLDKAAAVGTTAYISLARAAAASRPHCVLAIQAAFQCQQLFQCCDTGMKKPHICYFSKENLEKCCFFGFVFWVVFFLRKIDTISRLFVNGCHSKV